MTTSEPLTSDKKIFKFSWVSCVICDVFLHVVARAPELSLQFDVPLLSISWGYIVFFSLLSCRHSASALVLLRKSGKINLTLADMRHVAPLATETMFNGRLQDREFHLSFLLSLSELAHGPEKSSASSPSTQWRKQEIRY